VNVSALAVDHVVIAVRELDAAAAALTDRYGLAVAGGGRHPGWGTANRIVPLGSAYLELVSVADEPAAAGSTFGRWVRAMYDAGPALGWAARTDELTSVAGRLDLGVVDGSRVDAQGRELRWRVAGVEVAAAEPALPFLIQWSDGTPHPGAAAVTHPAGPVSLTALHVGGGARTSSWLGAATAGVVVDEGPPVVHRVVLSTASGELVLDDDTVRALG
jgi:hypothetical protein